MSKLTSTLIAVAALTLSGGAFAQSAGGGNGTGGGAAGSTASPTNQVNGAPGGAAAGGYGTPGNTGADSGMSTRAPNSGLPSMNSNTKSDDSAPKSNNTLATPSVKSPAGQ
ncbi:hypothetical protein LJ656_10850 [Paraburkholderia sp. MMS20-SJTR3]|uniref:Serine protease autotransporter n=1 Tax=Paraburkholderia sejongensis TaxID=2886946 RepID=A0ABS8JTR6_9BURK|nr:hypothetical protein [Paraburkholderia sp. MMS20-SJTR3]MCC8393088.1 hypothetical protein [Paraburkholderia sp. MMS20-SJTR3]